MVNNLNLNMAGETSTPQNQTTLAQEKVAKTVTTIVLVGTCVLGALGMSIAIVAMCQKNFAGAKDILQILFSAILPLFGTWIGTILAYYFSRENLLAANQTVQHLVNKITSDDKLKTIKARDVMIPIDQLTFKPYPTGTDDSKINLKTDFLDFINSKKISRVLLLDENKNGKYVLHRSTIEGFIAEQYFNSPQDEGTAPQDGGTTPPADEGTTPPQDGGTTPPRDEGTAPLQEGGTTPPQEGGTTPPADAGPTPSRDGGPTLPAGAAASGSTPSSPRALTFADMKLKGNASVQAILRDGVKYIGEDASLADAKLLIKSFSVCNDVFITKNGAANEQVLGWITDKTIAEHSIV
jgi:hypothetical protein